MCFLFLPLTSHYKHFSTKCVFFTWVLQPPNYYISEIGTKTDRKCEVLVLEFGPAPASPGKLVGSHCPDQENQAQVELTAPEVSSGLP